MSALYDVLAVDLATLTVRLIGQEKNLRDAEAEVKLAVMRQLAHRSVNTEFFVEVISGSYREGERWVGQKETA